MAFDQKNGAVVTYDRKSYTVVSARAKPVVLKDTPNAQLEERQDGQ